MLFLTDVRVENDEDSEARGLLNKFLGAQVILSGIESNIKTAGHVTHGSSGKKATTKITTTVTVIMLFQLFLYVICLVRFVSKSAYGTNSRLFLGFFFVQLFLSEIVLTSSRRLF